MKFPRSKEPNLIVDGLRSHHFNYFSKQILGREKAKNTAANSPTKEQSYGGASNNPQSSEASSKAQRTDEAKQREIDAEIKQSVLDMYIYDPEPILQSEIYKVIDLLLRVRYSSSSITRWTVSREYR